MRRHVGSPIALLAIAIGLLGAAIWYARSSVPRESLADAKQLAQVGCGTAAAMFRQHRSGQWLSVSGAIERTLDDTFGRYQHQRFILACRDGMTLLIVNDVSVGQRVPVTLRSRAAVHGQYVWDSHGGLVHFTHHADNGAPGGWILFESHVYQ